MDLSVTGNPGQGNTFSETRLQSTGSYNPNAHEVNHYHYASAAGSRMDSYFQSLMQEIESHVKAEVLEELKEYTTKLDGTKDVEEKLTDGGFRPSRIEEAKRMKEMYAKKAMQYDCYPSAQKIILYLFAQIKHEFNTSIFPLIEDGESLRTVMEQLRTKIVRPIMQSLDANGAHDRYLNFTDDHIYGMIYYLTGMCHLNWKDYDNL